MIATEFVTLCLSFGFAATWLLQYLVNASNIRFKAAGVAGTAQLVLAVTGKQTVSVAVVFLILVTVSALVLAYKRASTGVSDLLSSTFEN